MNLHQLFRSKDHSATNFVGELCWHSSESPGNSPPLSQSRRENAKEISECRTIIQGPLVIMRSGLD